MAGWSVTISIDSSDMPHPEIDEDALTEFLQQWGDDVRNFFISNMGGSPSPPGAYPGSDTGQLAGSIDVAAGYPEATISANTSYAGFLASGTRKMAKRKMMVEAAQECPIPDPPSDIVRFT